jgi:hypothetical protein
VASGVTGLGHDGAVGGVAATTPSRAINFKGWPDSALHFFEGLEADNSKAYWLDHKEVYERDVRAPMEALLADLRDDFGTARMFRPYRDTRLSSDKSFPQISRILVIPRWRSTSTSRAVVGHLLRADVVLCERRYCPPSGSSHLGAPSGSPLPE